MRKLYGVLMGAALALMAAMPVAAAAHLPDFSDDLTTGVAGFAALVAAAIAAVIVVAITVRLSFRAARTVMKALGLIK